MSVRMLCRAVVGVASVLACTGLPVAAGAAPPPVGVLTQLSGAAGCLSIDGSSEAGLGTCTATPHGVDFADSVLVSPDGRYAYVTTYSGELGVFARNTMTGALTQLSGTAGCFAQTASAACTEARGERGNLFGDGRDLAITRDGRWLYVVSQGTAGRGGVLLFSRDPASGRLTQLAGAAGCISSDGSDQDGAGHCQIDATLNEPSGVSLSPDDAFLYVVDYFHPTPPKHMHVFARNATSGALKEVQCLSEAPAPTGCTAGRVLGDSKSLAISADGRHAYGGDINIGLSVFDRDPATGLLTQKSGTAGCITATGKDDTGAAGSCAVGRVVVGAYPLTLAPDGSTLFAPAGNTARGVSVFHVSGDGTLAQLAGTAGCITATGKDESGHPSCAIGRDLNGLPYGGEISPDGRTMYIANDGTSPGGIDSFAVDPVTGALTQLPGTAGCTTTDGSSDGTAATAGQCATGRTLTYGYDVALSPDGSSVYYAANKTGTGGGVSVFTRQAAPVCQPASATATSGKPTNVALRCTSPNGEPVTVAIASSPAHGSLTALDGAGGTVVYTSAAGYAGSDTFTFTASDGTNTGVPATATLTIAKPTVIPSTVIPPIVVPPIVRPAAPRLTGLHLSSKVLRVGRAHSRRTRHVPSSVTVSFSLDKRAGVTLAFQAQLTGRRSHGRCVAPSRKLRHARSCRRLKGVGSLGLAARAGQNAVRFTGRLGRHTLAPGTYLVTVAATAVGKRSAPATLVLRVIKG